MPLSDIYRTRIAPDPITDHRTGPEAEHRISSRPAQGIGGACSLRKMAFLLLYRTHACTYKLRMYFAASTLYPRDLIAALIWAMRMEASAALRYLQLDDRKFGAEFRLE